MLDWTLYGRLSTVLIAQIKPHKVHSGIAAETQDL